MIHGDIDLTENLDFYKDRKEKYYKNTRDLSNKPSHTLADDISDNASIIWTNAPDITASFTYNNTTFNTDLISNASWNNNYYLSYNNISNTWDFNNIISYDNFDNFPTLSALSSQNINYNINTSNDTIISVNIPYIPSAKKPNQCTKLFGEKPVKEYSNYNVIRKFSNKPKKEYKNSKIFKNVALNRFYSNIEDRYNAWLNNWGTNISSDIYWLFGNKREPDEEYNHRFSPVPWLEDFAKRHRRLFDDYMEELRGNDVDNDNYLTDYGWLRIH